MSSMFDDGSKVEERLESPQSPKQIVEKHIQNLQVEAVGVACA